PVDDAVLERMEVDLDDRSLLTLERRLGVIAPKIRGGDDDALRERLLARRGEEAVDVGLLEAVIGRVELALDRVDVAGGGRGDEVNACVALVELLLAGPFSVRKHLAV